MVTVTPGMTAFCASVIAPWRVAVDCASAGELPVSSSTTAPRRTQRRTDLSRVIIHPPYVAHPRAGLATQVEHRRIKARQRENEAVGCRTAGGLSTDRKDVRRGKLRERFGDPKTRLPDLPDAPGHLTL